MTEYDNESWIILAGEAVIRRRDSHGLVALKPLDRLIYCLWVADYGMRNAGDLDTASEVYASFQEEAARLAQELELPVMHSAFSLGRADLEEAYFQFFEDICNELRGAEVRARSSD